MAKKRSLKVKAEDVLKLLIDANKRYEENFKKLQNKINEIETRQNLSNKEIMRITEGLKTELNNLFVSLNSVFKELTKMDRRGESKVEPIFQCGVLVFDANRTGREVDVERFKTELMELMKKYGIGAVNASFISDITKL